VVHRVREEQVEGEEGGAQEEVVQRVEVDLLHERDDEDPREEEEQRHRREGGHLGGEGPGLIRCGMTMPIA
jgi:hypothetical protein